MSRTRRCRGDRELQRQVAKLTRTVRDLERLLRDMKYAGRVIVSALRAGEPADPEGHQSYWTGWTDGWEAGRGAVEGQLRTAMRQAGVLQAKRPPLKVVPAPEDAAANGHRPVPPASDGQGSSA